MKHTTKAATQYRYFTIDTPIPAESCLFGWDVKPGGLFKGTQTETEKLRQNDPVIIEFKSKTGETVLFRNSHPETTTKLKTLIGRVTPIENNGYMELAPIDKGTPPLIFRTRNAKLYRLESYCPPAFNPNAPDTKG